MVEQIFPACFSGLGHFFAG